MEICKEDSNIRGKCYRYKLFSETLMYGCPSGFKRTGYDEIMGKYMVDCEKENMTKAQCPKDFHFLAPPNAAPVCKEVPEFTTHECFAIGSEDYTVTDVNCLLVSVCLPELDPNGIGYIRICDEYGLKGGGSINIDSTDLSNAITDGYRLLGRDPETLGDWNSFLQNFSYALARVDLCLRNPSDPGNMRNMFLQMACSITKRNVRLTNYEEAWINVSNHVRSKIDRYKKLSLDPSKYPSNCYWIKLVPDANKMLPFISTMDSIYMTSVGGTVTMDFHNILGIVNVDVTLTQDFVTFESQEMERMEKEQMINTKREVDRLDGEVESLSNQFQKLNNQWEEMKSSNSNFVKKDSIKKLLKEIHVSLSLKLDLLSRLEKADENTIPKRKSVVIKANSVLNKIEEVLQDLDNFNCQSSIRFENESDVKNVSEFSKEILLKGARASLNTKIVITSTIRDAYNQARIMYDNLVKHYEDQRRLYKWEGQQVINVFDEMKKKGASRIDSIKAMEKKIIELDPPKVSDHCGDEKSLLIVNVVDISMSNLENPKDFQKTLSSYKEVKKVLFEKTNYCVHVEILQQ
eukprot:gene3854-4805_t